MIDIKLAVIGLRAAAPSVPDEAVEAMRTISFELKDSILSSVQCAAVCFGQFAHESSEFNAREENLNYSASAMMRSWPSRYPTALVAAPYARDPEALANHTYGGRMGNVNDGDGWRYRGRGYIQVTGRENYTHAAIALGFDYVGNPDLASEPVHAWRIADWYMTKNNLIELAQRGDDMAVTRGINGGTHGLGDRKRRTALALAAMQERVAPVEIGYVSQNNRDTVSALQRRLQRLGYGPGPIDGMWGNMTVRALIKFQNDHDLAPDGVVGLMTRTALNKTIDT